MEKYARPRDFVLLFVALAVSFFLIRAAAIGVIPTRWSQLFGVGMTLVALAVVLVAQRRHR